MVRVRLQKPRRPWRLIGIPVIIISWEILARVFVDQSAGEQSRLPSLIDVVHRDLPAFAGFGVASFGHTSSYPVALRVLYTNATATVKLVLFGTGLGILLGVMAGLAISRWSVLRRAAEPIVLVVRTIPLLALIPLFLLWFGGAYVGNVVFIVFAVSMMLVINTVEAVRNVAPVHRSFARTLGASENQVFRTVIVPAIVPEMVGGIRVALGLSWAIALGAEFLASQSGLGRLLILSQNFLYTGRMLVIVFLFGLFATVVNAVALRLGRRITRWMP
jgi:ABC-type nitrate/sulfonate/bicarbonate transport system permease component